MRGTVLISTEHLDNIMINREFATFESIAMCERVNKSTKWKYRITNVIRYARR